MRELRKETEIIPIFESISYKNVYLIRNERTPKGDGNPL